ncbi:MAG: hypothetical protein SF097_25430 [Acidobacteriota bacterium]|nr:hypothetical protein [Acidobacteriota bacterium]
MNDKITILEDDDFDLNDDLPPSLDLENMPRAVEQERKYRERARQKMIRLTPDVAEVFDSSDAVNEALRTLIRLNRAGHKAA